jgi:hypothetical protein
MHEPYDALVAASPERSVFAASWWLDAVAGDAWRPHLVEKGGEAVAAWPTVQRATRLGTVHAGAPLTPFLGPLFAPDEDPVRRRSSQVHALAALAEELEPCAHIEARCNPAFDYWAPLAWQGYEQTTAYTWRLLDLGDLDAVLAGMKGNVRGDIRKAEKRNVTLAPGSLDEFLGVHGKTAASKGFEGRAAQGRQTLARIEAAAAPRGARTILLARDAEQRVHAGAYLVHDDRFTYYLVGGSDPELRSSGAGSLVVWSAIQEAAGRKVGFDFEGSMLPTVERFFRAFGGTPAPYSVVRKTPSSVLRALRPVKRALRRRRTG